MNKITKILSLVLLSAVVFAGSASAVAPSDFGLKEGDVVRASGDLDVYIVNDHGFKRLFVNPQIFNLYGHLGFQNVKSVSPSTRDAFITSGLFRNCQTNDTRVYGLEVVSEDVAALHWINISGSQAVSEDATFFNKVFCINSAEQALYNVGSAYTSLSQVPAYSRGGTTTPVGDVAVLSSVNLSSQTITKNATTFPLLIVDFKGNKHVDTLKVKRLGVGANSNFVGNGVYLYKDGKRLTDVRSFNSDGVATFSNLNLNGSFTLSVLADFDGVVSNVARVELQGDYNGLPLSGNSFTFANAQSGKVEFTVGGTLDPIVVGQNNAQVAEFKASASLSEDVTIKHIELRNNGNADLSNVVLKVDDKSFSGSVSGDKVVFNLDTLIKANKTKTFKVFADVDGRDGDTVKLYIENSYDIQAVGAVYGFGVVVEPSSLTLQNLVLQSNGSLDISLDNDLDSQAVVWGDDGKAILGFTFESNEESFTIEELNFTVDSDVVDKVYLYSGSSLLASANVDDNSIEFDSLSIVVNDERDFVLKADFKSEADVASASFSPKLVSYVATGNGSDEEVSGTPNLTGEVVYVYSALPKFTYTGTTGNQNHIANIEHSVLKFNVTAVGGDVRFASGSPAFVLKVTENSPSSFAYRVLVDNDEMASGSAPTDITVVFADDVVINEGDTQSVEVLVTLNSLPLLNPIYRVELKDLDSKVFWQIKDEDDNWVNAGGNIAGTLTGLPLTGPNFVDL